MKSFRVFLIIGLAIISFAAGFGIRSYTARQERLEQLELKLSDFKKQPEQYLAGNKSYPLPQEIKEWAEHFSDPLQSELEKPAQTKGRNGEVIIEDGSAWGVAFYILKLSPQLTAPGFPPEKLHFQARMHPIQQDDMIRYHCFLVRVFGFDLDSTNMERVLKSLSTYPKESLQRNAALIGYSLKKALGSPWSQPVFAVQQFLSGQVSQGWAQECIWRYLEEFPDIDQGAGMYGHPLQLFLDCLSRQARENNDSAARLMLDRFLKNHQTLYPQNSDIELFINHKLKDRYTRSAPGPAENDE